jgi:hypothetical protein
MPSARILDVPYFTQPSPITCQSTCLKMFAKYLEQRMQMSSAGAEKSVYEIWKEINEDPERPSKVRNSYENFSWWLQKYFGSRRFEVKSSRSVDEAIQLVVRYIDHGYPVMVSTNHSRTDGHIILVVGYENFEPSMSSARVNFVCHDPYGKFNPALGSKLFGKRRFDTGMSLMSGGEIGPGKGLRYDYDAIRRVRRDKHSSGTYFLVSARIAS